MVARDANEYPETISGETQGGRPLHFLRVLSWVPLLEYPPNIYGDISPTRILSAKLDDWLEEEFGKKQREGGRDRR